MTGGQSRKVKSALKKLANTASEKLILEVDMAIPRGLAEKYRVEVIAKLIQQLKAGPLKNCNDNNQAHLDSAIQFLVTEEGRAWDSSWFIPNVVESSSNVANAPLGDTPKEVVAPETLSIIFNRLPVNVVDDTGVPTVSLPGSVPTIPGGNPHTIVSVKTSIDLKSLRSPSPAPALLSPVARGANNRLTLSGPGVSQHQGAHSDPGQLPMCPRCHNVHCASLGGSASLIMGGLELRRVANNDERWMVRTMRHVTNPINIITWSLFIVLIAFSKGGYPKH